MKKIKRALAVILSSTLLLSVTGCSGGETKTTPSAGPAVETKGDKAPETPSASGMTKEEADAAEPVKIGVCIGSL